MKKTILILFLFLSFSYSSISQDLKPYSRWFVQPQLFGGYTLGSQKSGFGYGGGMRCLYDFQTRFLGGPVFLGVETTYLSSLQFVKENLSVDLFEYKKQNYIVISPVLEQNYSWLKNSFHIATGVGYYKGIHAQKRSAVGLITNIGWFPIYKGKAITPCITYRNDWVFDKNQTNMQSISLSLNF